MVQSITEEQANGVASNGVEHINGIEKPNVMEPANDTEHSNGVEKPNVMELTNGTEQSNSVEKSNGIEHTNGTEHSNGVEKSNGVEHTNGIEHSNGVEHAKPIETSYEAPPAPVAAAPYVPSYLLTNKVALVTGAGRGMGRETALELARRGAKVVVNYANSTSSAEAVVAEIKAMHKGSDAIAIKADVSKVSETVKLFEEAMAYFGRLDIVCSNSGVVSFGHLKDVTEEEFDRVFSINTRGQFFVAREAYKNLSVGGRIILMGSITGQAKGVPSHTIYSASKGAIETFVRCMAIDCGDKRITVNAVAPGGIKTDMYHAVCKEYIPNGENLNHEEIDEYAKTWSPHRRVGMPIDVARVTAFLASEDGEWVNGKVIGVDGAACM